VSVGDGPANKVTTASMTPLVSDIASPEGSAAALPIQRRLGVCSPCSDFIYRKRRYPGRASDEWECMR